MKSQFKLSKLKQAKKISIVQYAVRVFRERTVLVGGVNGLVKITKGGPQAVFR